ncbi:Mitochondrial zinc maintenance protein 1 [Pleodorina starrii]|nr:Mitochondrial zinc maintenance protein 1 [Pleodorina starrii]
MTTKPSISIFRQLIRTVHKTFAGDLPAISVARKELKNAFMANRHLTDKRQINEKLAEAVEANEFLRENVIQAVKKDCGSYGTAPAWAWVGGPRNPNWVRYAFWPRGSGLRAARGPGLYSADSISAASRYLSNVAHMLPLNAATHRCNTSPYNTAAFGPAHSANAMPRDCPSSPPRRDLPREGSAAAVHEPGGPAAANGRLTVDG